MRSLTTPILITRAFTSQNEETPGVVRFPDFDKISGFGMDFGWILGSFFPDFGWILDGSFVYRIFEWILGWLLDRILDGFCDRVLDGF